MHSLPINVLGKISGHLSNKEIVSLASTHTLFYGKSRRNDFNFNLNLLAKKRRLLELKDSQYFSGYGNHYLLTDNKVYAWGRHMTRLLDEDDTEWGSKPIEFNIDHLNLAPEDKIKQLLCGFDYNIFLTEKGRCFGWRGNKDGQLGVGDNQYRNSPTEINFNHLNLASGDKVKQVMVRNNHTIYLTEQGRCFGCGRNLNGELGLGDNENRNSPTEITFNHLNLAPGDKVKQVLLDASRTIYLTEQGRCFGCGKNACGELGVGDNQNRNRLAEITFNHLNLAFGDKIKQVIKGLHYFLFLTEQGCCCISGENIFAKRDEFINRPIRINFKNFGWTDGDTIRLMHKGFLESSELITNHEVFVVHDNPYSCNLVNVTPEFMRHKHQLIQSILNDISQLALIALDSTDYGFNFKQILFQQAQILSYPWIHEIFLNELQKLATAKEQKSLINSLKKLLYLYDYLNDLEPSPDLTSRQQDFVELLLKLQNDEINDFTQLKEYFLNTIVSRSYPRLAQYNNSNLQLNIFAKLSTSYEIRQELLFRDVSQLQDQREAFSSLKIAAKIILHGLNAATQENGVAFILRDLIVGNPTSSQKLKPF